jgi:hypothetical protein
MGLQMVDLTGVMMVALKAVPRVVKMAEWTGGLLAVLKAAWMADWTVVMKVVTKVVLSAVVKVVHLVDWWVARMAAL